MGRRCPSEKVFQLNAIKLITIFAIFQFNIHDTVSMKHNLNQLDLRIENLKDSLNNIGKVERRFNKKLLLGEELWDIKQNELFAHDCAKYGRAVEGLRVMLKDLVEGKIKENNDNNHEFPGKMNTITEENELMYLVQLLYRLDYEETFNATLHLAKHIRNRNSRFLVYKESYKQLALRKMNNVNTSLSLLKSIQEEILKEVSMISECTKNEALKFEEVLMDNLRQIGKDALQSRYLYQHFGRGISDDLVLQTIFEGNSHLFQDVMREFLSVMYNINGVGADKLIRFVNSSSFVEQRVLGLRDILTLVRANNDDGVIISIANIAKQIKENKSNNLVFFATFMLGDLIANLPESVRNLVFAEKVCIRNTYWKNFVLTIGRSDDNYRHFVGIEYSKNKTLPNSVWRMPHIKDNIYTIGNVHHKNEYIHAIGDLTKNLYVDVATWKSGAILVQSLWQVIPEGEFCYLRNVFFGSYLSNDVDLFSYNNNFINVDVYLWKIEDCST